MPEFTLSKQLRELAVVEFVVLLLNLLPICKLRFSANGESKCSVLQILRRVFSYTFSLLQQGIFCALLVLVYKQASVCNDSMLTVVLVTSTVLFSLKLFSLIVGCIRSEPNDKVTTIDEESCNKSNNDNNESASNLVNSSSMGIDFNKQQAKLKWRSRLPAIFSPVICLGTLGLAVCGVFFLATTIKLAIPSDYTTKCSCSFESKFIMLGNLVAAVIINSVYLLAMLPQRILAAQMKCSGVIYVSVLVITIVFCCATNVWLFVRLAKVWRGSEPELYEYMALGLILPLLSP